MYINFKISSDYFLFSCLVVLESSVRARHGPDDGVNAVKTKLTSETKLGLFMMEIYIPSCIGPVFSRTFYESSSALLGPALVGNCIVSLWR